jgi:hypothetical protein
MNESRRFTLSELRDVSQTVIENNLQSVECFHVMKRAIASGALLGMRKGALVEWLGPGYRCESLAGHGDGAERVCYNMGHLPKLQQGGIPVLALDFDEDALCTNAIAVHTQ